VPPVTHPSGSKQPVFEIWQAGDRIVSVDDPVRLKILALLEVKPRTLKQLAAAVNRSKPTLSAGHVPWLMDAGLLASATDPADARVKWFRLVGHRLGSSAVEKPQLRDAVLGFVATSGLVPLAPVLHILDVDHVLRASSPDYYLALAARLGALLQRHLMSSSPGDRRRELARILKETGLWKPGDEHVRRRFLAVLQARALRSDG
jgi:hypothetical protein